MRIAVDVMGGDNAPDSTIQGCVLALDALDASDELVLVGDRAVIEAGLEKAGASDARLKIEHASEVIEMNESPAKAVRGKPDSSIVRMARMGSSKAGDERADVVISAGNTGACVSAGIMHMKRLRGVHRPGIAVTIPAFQNDVVLCDAGANPQPTATHLWQYGVMAGAFCKKVHGVDEPKIGLMNIGSEEAKGSELIRETRDLLKATPGLNYIGYIEGRDFFEGVADVVVTDGFLGNTVLKMAEGLAKSLFKAIMHEIYVSSPDLAAQFEPVVKQIYAKNDYHEAGGAPLLGVNGGFIISHGSSEAKSIAAAIKNGRRFAALGVNDLIKQRLAEVAHIGESHGQLA